MRRGAHRARRRRCRLASLQRRGPRIRRLRVQIRLPSPIRQLIRTLDQSSLSPNRLDRDQPRRAQRHRPTLGRLRRPLLLRVQRRSRIPVVPRPSPRRVVLRLSRRPVARRPSRRPVVRPPNRTPADRRRRRDRRSPACRPFLTHRSRPPRPFPSLQSSLSQQPLPSTENQAGTFDSVRGNELGQRLPELTLAAKPHPVPVLLQYQVHQFRYREAEARGRVDRSLQQWQQGVITYDPGALNPVSAFA